MTSPPVPDLANLAFDADEMLHGLERWVCCESPTFDAGAVNAMMTLASGDLERAGATLRRVPGRGGFGDCVVADFPHPRRGEPGILLMGHLDTVHPVGTLQKLPFRREGARCWGPGILDMKGGIYAALEAVIQLSRAGAATPLPVSLLLTSDEEVGSPSTRELILETARRHRYVLVPEPGRPGNGVVSGRYAIARYALTATGRPSHAGAALKEGRSAIGIMARQILAIEEMSGEACTFSVGVIHGGQWVNCVTTHCRAEALSMAKRQEDLDDGVARMFALAKTHDDGTAFDVTRGVTRPVWEAGAETMRMFEVAKGIAAERGQDLTHGSAGGGSDGNFTGAGDIATLDGLGCLGAGYHTLDEHIEVSSLIDRGRLLAGLLARLA